MDKILTVNQMKEYVDEGFYPLSSYLNNKDETIRLKMKQFYGKIDLVNNIKLLKFKGNEDVVEVKHEFNISDDLMYVLSKDVEWYNKSINFIMLSSIENDGNIEVMEYSVLKCNDGFSEYSIMVSQESLTDELKEGLTEKVVKFKFKVDDVVAMDLDKLIVKDFMLIEK